MSELSFWGWGYADKFPNAEARKNLAGFAGAMLKAQFEPQPPPRLDALELSPSRLQVSDSLAAMCATSVADRASHTYGKSYRDLVRGFHGDFAPAPDIVARPKHERDVAAFMDWCTDNNAALIPFGGGTSVVGGVETDVSDRFAGVVSLDLRGLDRVLEVDPISRAARIQAGATGPVLEQQLAEHGFTLRHFPQSFEFSTLGGWIATRAGGHFATVYTHIDDLVESTRMLTSVGPFESRRLPGSGAGPSPDRLVLGSEGTLGIITEAWMRVHERPRWRSSASVKFTDFDAAVTATRTIAQAKLFPSNCRLLDAREAMLHQITGDGSNVLLLGFESADHPVEDWLERALAIATSHGGKCPKGPVHKDDDAASGGAAGETGAWRNAFLQAPYMFNALVSMGVVVDTFETACTWDRFDELHAAVIANVRAAMKRECGGGIVSCRFTHVYPDGPAPYYTFIAPGKSGGELQQWQAIKHAANDTLIEHGATITHHHAVGRMHRPWYERQRPAMFGDVLAAAKRVLDPRGILNPGVLIQSS